MPDYVQKSREHFGHQDPEHPQHYPHKYTKPVFGKRKPQAPIKNTTGEYLDEKDTKRIQEISGTYLYYGRGVDSSILPTLNEILTQQSAPTTGTTAKTDMLFDYLATHPDAKVRFYATNMYLYLESDAAHLVLPRARIRCAVYYYLGDKLQSPTNKPAITGAVHVLCKTIPNVVSSAAEPKREVLLGNIRK